MHINPEKLLLSKWRAAIVSNKEKHFIVVDLIRDEQLRTTHCVIEAVLTKNTQTIQWQQLADNSQWLPGW
jgi:tryptophan-rich hypothetical protein